MTAKEYLGQAFLLEIRIGSKLEQVEVLRSTATKAASVLTGMPNSARPNHSRMEDAIVKIVDLENEIAEQVKNLVAIKRDVSQTISKIDDARLQVILELRYLCFMDWHEIASEMNYHHKYLLRLHKQALEKVDTIRYQKCTSVSA